MVDRRPRAVAISGAQRVENFLSATKAQATQMTLLALIGDADAELCGPDGCAISADHAAFEGEA